MSWEPDDALIERLRRSLRFGPEYSQGLSNHLPMALLALHRLGASAEQMDRFETVYTPRLLPAPPNAPWPPGAAWREPFGQQRAYAKYVELFRHWRQAEGSGEVLEQALPWLMPGCAAMAFHGLIRTAHAAQAGLGEELDAALASWACRYLPLGELPAAPGEVAEPEALLRRLPAGTSKASLIAKRMAEAAAQVPELARAVPLLAVHEGTPAELARLAAHAYAATGNFTALHLVTSAHALRLLLPRCEDKLAAIRWYWQAFATGVVAAGLKPKAEVPRLSWEQVRQHALASTDEHVIKLVDSCIEQHAADPAEVWLAAASRACAVS